MFVSNFVDKISTAFFTLFLDELTSAPYRPFSKLSPVVVR